MAGNYILSLDEGSSSARAVIIDAEGRVVAQSIVDVGFSIIERDST